MYKVINVQDIDLYPDDYDWLNSDQKTIIISYLNGVQDLANRYYNNYLEELNATFDPNYKEEHNKDIEKYLRLYNHTNTSLTGSSSLKYSSANGISSYFTVLTSSLSLSST